MVMVRCALCGKKIKRKKAVKHLVSWAVCSPIGEKEGTEELYFCSEDHRKAWVLYDHLMFYLGDIDQARRHLIELHGWDEEDVDKALSILESLGVMGGGYG